MTRGFQLHHEAYLHGFAAYAWQGYCSVRNLYCILHTYKLPVLYGYTCETQDNLSVKMSCCILHTYKASVLYECTDVFSGSG